MNYSEFIETKKHSTNEYGFAPIWYPNEIFDFQAFIVEKSVKKGRIGVFIDTGLGKTRIALTIAQNIILKTNKKVLILTPLAVAFQFIKEAETIGIDDIEYSKDGKHTKKIVLCNYERLHYMNWQDFECVICDESSILKNFQGKIKTQITEFVKKISYRFLMSATPAPNDFIEIGTSSEALGYMGYMDMLSRYFKNNQKTNDSRAKNIGEKYYLKPHAKTDFFEWINTWAIMIKMPSDLGYSDENYILPNLIENTIFVNSVNYEDEHNQMSLLPIIAKTMSEIRHEQKQTKIPRCEKAVELAKDKVSVYWCNTNSESAILKSLDKYAVEIIGSQSIEQKEEALKAFADGEINRLITKSLITGQGLNWQHCNYSVFFPTWSYESYYQSIRRFWRFGQKKDVTIDIVLSAGQERVMQAILEKKDKAIELYENLISNVNTDFKIIQSAETQEFKTPVFI